MQLTFDEIKKITVGAVRMEQQEEGIRFDKCLQSQIDAWYKEDEILGFRAETATGIRLDFWTDSSEVVIELRKAKFDVDINGLLYKRYETEDETMKEITIPMPKGENRITIYMPSHDIAVAKKVCLDDGATVKPHQFDRKMLMIGDSITQGWNSGFDSLSYAYLTSKALNAESVINGIGGAYYEPTTFAVPDFDPDIVTVAYGCNDYGYHSTDLETFKTAVTEYLGLIKENYGDKKVFVLTPIWRFDACVKEMGTFEEWRNAIREIAEGYGFNVIDGYQMVPHVEEFFDDDVHPNALGFSVYARNLVAAMKKRM